MSGVDMSTLNPSPPLGPAVFHILLALAGGDRHGYAVMQAVHEQSGGRVPLRTGSFYRHLGKLIDAGLVDAAPRRPADDDPRRGTYYRLTARGRQALAAEQQRLLELVATMKRLRPAARKG
jgi:DNA-binding PadR family transcriptional regulator